MDIATTTLSGVPLVEVSGEIDHASSEPFERSISAVLAEDDRIVLIDVSEVTYLDSGGISVLVTAVRRVRHSGWVGVVGANPNVKRLIEIVGLSVDHGLRMFPDRTAAVEAVDGFSSE